MACSIRHAAYRLAACNPLLTVSKSHMNHIRSISSRTKYLLEMQTMKVPTMGDSITEGTIVEWIAQVGQAVSDGDVVAMIETDKVTIEIKAVKNGVITKHFGKIDESIEVGADLYELDTDGVASVSETSNSPDSISRPESENMGAVMDAVKMTDVESDNIHRNPSIKFLGKDGWAKLKTGVKETGSTTATETISSSIPASPTPTPTINVKPTKAFTIYDDKSISNPLYGRPKFTEEEIEALMMGGASVAPQIIKHSTGAKFKL